MAAPEAVPSFEASFDAPAREAAPEAVPGFEASFEAPTIKFQALICF